MLAAACCMFALNACVNFKTEATVDVEVTQGGKPLSGITVYKFVDKGLGLGIANYMRTIKSEKQIKLIFWLSTLLFAGVHITNIFSSGNPLAGIFQVTYCVGVGAILGAVYLRTANLWVVMIAHFTLDFAGLINGYYSSTGGLSTQLLASDWVNLAVTVIGIVTALILLSPRHYPEIMELWKEKWSQ